LFLEFFIAFRYLLAKRKQIFISLITIISIAGVAVGVAALIVVMSVMSGFETELKSRILGNNAHIVVMRYGGAISDYKKVMERVQKVPGVRLTAPFVLNQVMIAHGRTVSGVVFRGIDPENDPLGKDVRSQITAGSFMKTAADTSLGSHDYPDIVLGSEQGSFLPVCMSMIPHWFM